jgi:hypothetical protein
VRATGIFHKSAERFAMLQGNARFLTLTVIFCLAATSIQAKDTPTARPQYKTCQEMVDWVRNGGNNDPSLGEAPDTAGHTGIETSPFEIGHRPPYKRSDGQYCTKYDPKQSSPVKVTIEHSWYYE